MEGLVDHSTLGCPGYEVVNIGNSGYTYDHCNIGWHRELMSPDGKVAVGLNDDKTIDEVLTDGASLHIEQMDEDCYWMMVNNRYAFHFTYAKGRRITLHYTEDIDG